MGCRTSHDTDVKPLVCFTSVRSGARRESDAREEESAQLLTSEQPAYTVAQLAIAWALTRPAIDVVIVGAKKPGQLAQSALAGEMHLVQETLLEIERIMCEAVPIGGPAPEGM